MEGRGTNSSPHTLLCYVADIACSTVNSQPSRRLADSVDSPGLLPPSPLRMLASDNYAWVYLGRGVGPEGVGPEGVGQDHA